MQIFVLSLVAAISTNICMIFYLFYKNKGEACSLAYAKATGILVFATDEMNLQPIIDSQLNTGIDDITCIRIVDIVQTAHIGEINIPRKICKALWLVAGKKKEVFDKDIWPVQ
jgi:hypothetical protein